MDPNGAAGGMNTVATTPVSASAGPSTGGQIQADPSTNSLIISAPEPVYRQIRQVIEQLDTRRAQVRVESIIVKVDASKSAEFGVQWQTLLGNSSSSTGVYTGTNFGSGGNNLLNLTAAAAGGSSSTTSSSGLTLPGAGLNIGVLQKVLGTWTLGALARFLETNAGGNVLSTPEIVALDNEEAKIVVGQNVPFITGSYTSTGTGSGATNPFQTIERKDVGLTLRIKSQVGEGGTVRMTIYQENSSVSQSTTSGLITDKSSIETTVLVDDGSTLVLGGLMKDEYTDNNSSVPLLADIPLIGHLFRSTTRSHTKSNLMVFLRPTVIRDQLTSDRITLNRYDAIRAMQSTVQPQGREWLLPVDGVTPLPSLAPATAPAAPTAPASAPAPAPAIPAPAAQ
jgi:general secretion pathway protein D